MSSVDYATLPPAVKPHAFDALTASTGEYVARFGQKPPTLEVDVLGLKVADLYVSSQMAGRNKAVRIGNLALAIDPKQFSTNMATLGAYMATNHISQIKVSEPSSLNPGLVATSLFAVALEAALNENHF